MYSLAVHKLHGGPGGVYAQGEGRESLKPRSLLRGEKKGSPGVFGNFRRGFEALRDSLRGRGEQKEGNPQEEEASFFESSWIWNIYKKHEESRDNFFHGFLHIEIP